MPNSTSPASILTLVSSFLPLEAPPRTLGHPIAPQNPGRSDSTEMHYLTALEVNRETFLLDTLERTMPFPFQLLEATHFLWLT